MTDQSNTSADATLDDLESVLAGIEKVLAGVRPDQTDDPTPCPDFDVSHLVDHVLGWSATYAARAQGVEAAAEPEQHTALPDAAREFRTYADTILAGYRVDPAPEKAVPVGILLMDYLTHGWDLARATGQEITYDDSAATAALEAGRAMLTPEYRGPDQQFGAEVRVADDAPAIDRLVGFMGRDPAWSAGS